MKKPLSKGFALLFAVLVVGTMMSLVFAILNITYKQIALSNISKNSAMAYYAADSGLECGRYWSAYGAFNPNNPAATLSSVDCLHTTISCQSNNLDGNGQSCALNSANYSRAGITNLNNPLYLNNPITYYYSLFTYPLGLAYSGALYVPQATVNVWQNGEFTPSSATDLTSAVLSTGINTTVSSPTQVQRGAGEIAGINQCLAPAFTYGINTQGTNGTYISHWVSPDDDSFAETVASYFPGESLGSLENDFSNTITKTWSQSTSFPYLAHLPPDNWSFSPNQTASLSISAQFLSPSGAGQQYGFGYYTGTIKSNFSNFVTLVDGNGSYPQAISAALGNNQNIHFALKGTDNGGDSVFLSTNVADNSINGSPDTINDHIIVLAAPMPAILDSSGAIVNVNAGDTSGSTRIGGKYVFGFDTSLSPSAYSDAVVVLQLAGCP